MQYDSLTFRPKKMMFEQSFQSVRHRGLKKRSILIALCLRNFWKLVVNLQRDLWALYAKSHLEKEICGLFQCLLRCLHLEQQPVCFSDDQEPD